VSGYEPVSKEELAKMMKKPDLPMKTAASTRDLLTKATKQA
jgi:hypothetical protein